MKTETLVYYKLDDYKDVRHKSEIFQLAFNTKEEAKREATKYLQNLLNDGEKSRYKWFDYQQRGFEFKPINERIITDDWAVRIMYEIQRRSKLEQKVEKTIEIDGEKYSRVDNITEYGEWETVEEYKGHYLGNQNKVCDYSIYIHEKLLDFFTKEV